MGQTNYAASKAEMIGFVARSLAPSIVAQSREIAAVAVAPGFIETPAHSWRIPVVIREVGRRLSGARDRAAMPADVARGRSAFSASPGERASLSGQRASASAAARSSEAEHWSLNDE